jgi:CRISPR-associated protein Cas5t
MEVLTVKVRALSVSFRRILDYNYQRTYPLPPPTTILGFLGAALGLSDRELWDKESIVRKVKISVLSLHVPGFAKDLWTVQKIKQGKIEELSPYFRELLFFPEYLLIFGGNKEIMGYIAEKLEDPTYPLSLGRDDELVRIIDLRWKTISKGDNRFSGTILPLDINEFKFKPILQEGILMEPPIRDRLPIGFVVSKKGIRTPLEKKTFTFIPPTLTIKLETIPNSLEIYSIGARNFVWLN